MASKSATPTNEKVDRTATAPGGTMDDMPVLSDREREELITSLRQAEARIQSGTAIEYDPKTFKDRLIAIYRNAKRPL